MFSTSGSKGLSTRSFKTAFPLFFGYNPDIIKFPGHMSNIKIISDLKLRTFVYSESIQTSKITSMNGVLFANYSAFLQKKAECSFISPAFAVPHF